MDAGAVAELQELDREARYLEKRRRKMLARRRAILASTLPGWPPGALCLWVVDADGLPPRPWRVYRDTVILCRALKAAVPAHCCVARQQASDMQRTRDTWRGEASAYPHCVTERCAQGRGIREALDPHASVTWRGAGPGGRIDRLRGGQAAQEAARKRMRLEGLLDEERILDVTPDPADE
jgi:hypothetical protein